MNTCLNGINKVHNIQRMYKIVNLTANFFGHGIKRRAKSETRCQESLLESPKPVSDKSSPTKDDEPYKLLLSAARSL